MRAARSLRIGIPIRLRYASNMKFAIPHTLLLIALALPATSACAQDTPEMLAAMRAMLPPLPAEVPHRDALSDDVRRSLPPLAIETHRWHADPAPRFVIVQGRRVEESGVVGQELWLREIRADGVVLQFRDVIFFQSR
jgi:hypothetical protein